MTVQNHAAANLLETGRLTAVATALTATLLFLATKDQEDAKRLTALLNGLFDDAMKGVEDPNILAGFNAGKAMMIGPLDHVKKSK